MYKITEKVALNPTVAKMVIEAPLIAKKAKPGQFIIVRPFEDSERIPLTVAGYDREAGTVDIIFQIVGGTTMELNSLQVGQSVHDFVGPLGRATEVKGLKKVCVVGGGVGCAIALPIARELHEQGCVVHSVIGFRNKDLLILEDEFKACSDELRVMTDDGSYGTKGVVTAALDELVEAGNQYDLVITIGPLIMMKFVVKTCQKHGLKSIVSMNPIMIDGTGMCGGCRLTVGGQTKFACVDGPDFDGDLVVRWLSIWTRKSAPCPPETPMCATRTLRKLPWATPKRWPSTRPSAASTARTNPARPAARSALISRSSSAMWPRATLRPPIR